MPPVVPFRRQTSAVLGLAFLLLAAPAGRAAPPAYRYVTPTDYAVDVWDSERGLPNYTVTALAQTPDGYVWAGTFNGLARFDGARFKVWNEAATPDFPCKLVRRLYVDRAGRLWASTNRGVACFRQGRWRIYSEADGWPGGQAGCLLEDRDGRLLATAQHRILRLEDDRFEDLPCPDAVDRAANLICVTDSDGDLWGMAAGAYLGRFTDGRWRQIALPEENGSPEKGPYALAPCRGGGIAVLARTRVLHFKDGQWEEKGRPPGDSPFDARSVLIEDGEGSLWVSQSNRALFRFEPGGRVVMFTEPRGGLPATGIEALFEDREGNLWVGLSGGGMARVKPRPVLTYDEEASLRERVIDSVAEEGPGRMLVATYGGGLVPFDDERQTFLAPLRHPMSGLDGDAHVGAILKDRAGVLWVGTYGMGLYRVERQEARLCPFQGEIPTPIRALLQDSAGTLWVGHDKGLSRFDGLVLGPVEADGEVPRGQIFAIAEDRDGDLWAGGSDGLFRRHAGQWEKVAPPGGGAYPIKALYRDRAGALWAGGPFGLDRREDDRLVRYGPACGLPPGEVVCVVQDDADELWLGVERQGLARVRRASLDAVAAGKQGRLDCLLLTKSEGLKTLDIRGGFQPNACKGGDGRLWFATLKGLAVVDPRRVPFNAQPPPVLIEEVSIDDRAVERPAAGRVTVPAGHHRVAIRYAALSFTAPEKMRFQYRLEGLDDSWQDVGTERTLNFTDLKPGTYSFRVRACNNDGVWNETGDAVVLRVAAFFWETGWFRGLAVAALLGLVGGGVYRVQNVRLRRQAERLAQERKLTAERARFAALAAANDSLVCFTDLEGRILYLNPAGRVLLGLGQTDDLAGRTIAEFYASPSAERMARAAALTPGSPRLETALRRADGGEFPVLLRMLAHERPEGGVEFFSTVARDISRRKRDEAALRESEERFRGAFDSAAIGMALVAHDGRWLKVNQALCDIVGYSHDELLATDYQSITHPDDLPTDRDVARRMEEGTLTFCHWEKRYIHKRGHVVWVLLSVGLVRDGRGAPAYSVTQVQDITERKLAEERTLASLREKEVLLKEVHHRVKNNLQVVSSLLSLQSGQVADPAAGRALAESQRRVRSMALIHESLYRSADLARIDFGAYVRALCRQLFAAFGVDGGRVSLRLRLDAVPLDLERAVPCGMLVNELVSNALEHAFPGGRSGTVSVELRAAESGGYALTVADDGVGLPPGLDYRRTRSLGLQLVCTLARQLSASVVVEQAGGTAFRITLGG